MAEVASFEAQNSALVMTLLQAQKQNEAVLGLVLLDPHIGGLQDSTAWVEG